MARKKSNIYHRRDGRWEGRMHISGTKKYKSVYGKTYTEAKNKLENLRISNNVTIKNTNELFSEIADKWLRHIRMKVKESSFNTYYLKLKKHIIPYFYDKKYSDVNMNSIENFISQKVSQGFSSKYISDILSVIKNIVNWANKVFHYNNELLQFKIPKTHKKEKKLMNDAEQKSLQKYLLTDGSKTSLGIFLAMYTGIRIGELCGLTYGDIDFDKKILHIRKSVQRISVLGKNTKTEIKICSPKTENSSRDIPLPDFLIEILKKYKSPDEIFLLSGNNKPVEPRCLTNRFKKILKNANLPSINFHSLRHTFATNCLQCNFDIKTLSEILGHSNVSTTMSIYIHSSMERKRYCMNMLSI